MGGGEEGGVGAWECHVPASWPHEGQGRARRGGQQNPSPAMFGARWGAETLLVAVESPQPTKSHRAQAASGWPGGGGGGNNKTQQIPSALPLPSPTTLLRRLCPEAGVWQTGQGADSGQGARRGP